MEKLQLLNDNQDEVYTSYQEATHAIDLILQKEPELLYTFYTFMMTTQSQTLAEVFVNAFRKMPMLEHNLLYLHTLLTEPWHTMYEDIVHMLQKYKNPASIPYLKKTMQTRFAYPESYGTGTRQLINQCGHALKSINTKESLAVIYELSNASDPVLRDEMLYRISQIENKGNGTYERNDDL